MKGTEGPEKAKRGECMEGLKRMESKENLKNPEAPVVSVIIPAYNCEKTIEKAIDSALIQQIPLEVIVINDCSRDGTADVVRRYRDDGRVRYYENPVNRGAAGSRNFGVSLAVGKYVAFLDSDDWWAPGKLTKQLAKLHATQTVLCSTARELMRPDGSPMGKTIPVPERISYKDLLRHNCINCSSVVLERSVALEFPMEHEDSHEDYITWLKVLEKYGNACAVNEPLLKYRLSTGGKSGNKLKSARMTFRVYRYMGFGPVKSVLCFCSYALHGVWKYR